MPRTKRAAPKSPARKKPPKPKVLPLSRLKGACEKELAIVRKEWPNGIPLTKAAANRAAELGLDLYWAANTLLTRPEYIEYERARKAATAPFKSFPEYERAKAHAILKLLLKR